MKWMNVEMDEMDECRKAESVCGRVKRDEQKNVRL
jgi:hypothetical protein